MNVRLKEFSTKPVINEICNHANVIKDSLRMKKIVIFQWINKKITEHKCVKCGKLLNWFEMTNILANKLPHKLQFTILKSTHY